MKRTFVFVLGLLFFLTSHALAQSIAPTKITKVTQVGHYYSGTTAYYVIRGTNFKNGITENFKLRGVLTPGLVQSCVTLASSLNTNALSSTSNLTLTFNTLHASGGNGPSDVFYDLLIDLKSCYLSSK